jgi:hypothetical protein
MKLIRFIDSQSFDLVIGVLSDHGFIMTKFGRDENIHDVIKDLARTQPKVSVFIQSCITANVVPENYECVGTYVPVEEAKIRTEHYHEWRAEKKAAEEAYDAKLYPFKRLL